MEEIKLTHFSHGGGCGCKIAPQVLDVILKGNEAQNHFPNLIVGNSGRDDAAVIELNGQALISTVDFFAPIVDDPEEFGRIAAANALSDIYAMGGKPLLAIAILGWPVKKIAPELAGLVVKGAMSICSEAGIPLAGGHSIDSPEPIFGLSVNGIAPLTHIKKNNTAKAGDLLFLTKRLGTGVLGTAIKRGLITPEDHVAVVKSMCTLNKAGEQFGKLNYISAMTDVTGFGLLGHLVEMTEGSNLVAEIKFSEIPIFANVENYIKQMCFPDNTYKNWNAVENKVSGIEGTSFIMLCDPQTSGGLLVAVHPDHADEFIVEARNQGIPEELLHPIGKLNSVKEGESIRIKVS